MLFEANATQEKLKGLSLVSGKDKEEPYNRLVDSEALKTDYDAASARPSADQSYGSSIASPLSTYPHNLAHNCSLAQELNGRGYRHRYIRYAWQAP
jgi:hypothetical protein